MGVVFAHLAVTAVRSDAAFGQHHGLAGGDPELVAVYVKEYHEEHARRVKEARKLSSRTERKLADAIATIERLVAAIASGAGAFKEVMDALAAAKAQRDGFVEQLAEMEALPVVALHPAITDDYRRQVAELHVALGDAAASPGAVPALRSLINRIVLTPKRDARGVEIKVEGRLAAIVALATGTAVPDELTAKLERVKGIEPSS